MEDCISCSMDVVGNTNQHVFMSFLLAFNRSKQLTPLLPRLQRHPEAEELQEHGCQALSHGAVASESVPPFGNKTGNNKQKHVFLLHVCLLCHMLLWFYSSKMPQKNQNTKSDFCWCRNTRWWWNRMKKSFLPSPLPRLYPRFMVAYHPELRSSVLSAGGLAAAKVGRDLWGRWLQEILLCLGWKRR